MSINATHSKINHDEFHGYLQGVIDGQKRGMRAMKIFAHIEFIKMLREICPEMVKTDDDIRTLKSDFLKRLEKKIEEVEYDTELTQNEKEIVVNKPEMVSLEDVCNFLNEHLYTGTSTDDYDYGQEYIYSDFDNVSDLIFALRKEMEE